MAASFQVYHSRAAVDCCRTQPDLKPPLALLPTLLLHVAARQPHLLPAGGGAPALQRCVEPAALLAFHTLLA